MTLTRSDGKPRDLLRKAFALIDQGASKNWDNITTKRAADIFDSLTTPEDDYAPPASAGRASLEEQWS